MRLEVSPWRQRLLNWLFCPGELRTGGSGHCPQGLGPRFCRDVTCQASDDTVCHPETWVQSSNWVCKRVVTSTLLNTAAPNVRNTIIIMGLVTSTTRCYLNKCSVLTVRFLNVSHFSLGLWVIVTAVCKHCKAHSRYRIGMNILTRMSAL